MTSVFRAANRLPGGAESPSERALHRRARRLHRIPIRLRLAEIVDSVHFL
jgi:hypothetical protein